MLTPMDIQQKRFHVGIGFDKKDVTTFFESVAESYERLYRSNAELKERVSTLEDKLQNYKSKEASLEKSIMLAEKDSEDKKSKASKEAKSIELDAKNRAKVIIGDAEERLQEAEAQLEIIKTQYAAYKSSFASFLKKQFENLQEIDFDVDSYIDPKYAGMFMGAPAPAQGGNSSLAEFNGDPQMRDESTLGGNVGGSYGMSMNPDAKATSSEVYTSLMKDNENFVDPFNPSKEENGRYNPYDGRKQQPKSKKSSQFTVAEAGKNRNRNKQSNPQSKSSSNSGKAQSPSVDSSISKDIDDIAKSSANYANSSNKTTVAEEQIKESVNKTLKEQVKESNDIPVAKEQVKESNDIPAAKEQVTESNDIPAAKAENNSVNTVTKEEINKTSDTTTAEPVKDSVENEKEAESFNNVSVKNETVSQEEDELKKKAKEFFKKAASVSDSSSDNSDDSTFVGEVESDVKKSNLIGAESSASKKDDDDSDEFGFEFF